MALSKETIQNTYPLPVYNYRVEIGGQAIGFTEVAGLSIGYEKYTYKESPTESGAAGPRIFNMPSQPSPVNITLKKGVVRSSSINALFGWINSIQTNQVDKRDVYVRLCDPKGDAVISWKVINAFPTKLDAPTFDSKSNDAAIESMELMGDGIFIEEN